MSLIDKFQRCFSEEAVEAGNNLAAAARRLWGADDRMACEFPEDSGVECSLAMSGRFLEGSCSCDEYKRLTCCRHLWAAIKIADGNGDLAKALKKNVPSRLYNHGFHSAKPAENGELNYEFDRRPRKPRSMTPDEDGRVLEYNREEPVIRRMATQIPFKRFDDSLPFEMVYIIRCDKIDADENALVIDVRWRPKPASGEKPQPTSAFEPEPDAVMPSAQDSAIMRLLAPWHRDTDEPNRYRIPVGDSIVHALAAARNLRWAENTGKGIVLHGLRVELSTLATAAVSFAVTDDARFRVAASLDTPEARYPMTQCRLLMQPKVELPGQPPRGFALADGVLFRVDFRRALPILRQRFMVPLTLDYSDAVAMVHQLAAETDVNLDSLPEPLAFRTTECTPVGELYVRTAKFKFREHEQLHAELAFNYNGISCPDDGADRIVKGRDIIRRDANEEGRLRSRLRELGFRYNEKAYVEEIGWKLHPSQLDNAVQILVNDGWLVTAEGKTYRRPATKSPSVSSGLDWFEVDGGVDFDGQQVGLPALLNAFSQGQKSVRLDDGTYGLLPLEWLANFTVLTELGEVNDDKLRFRMEQAALVSAIIQDRVEEAKGRYGEQLRLFESLSIPSPAKPVEGFMATLRGYQELGLGWLLNMQKAGFGACLADDMGLGKTIQVLAVLAERSRLPDKRPSLIVMPSSLIFNWQSEAAKFAPWLKILVHHGAGRRSTEDNLSRFDLVFTTYGTIRNDYIDLAQIQFDYCILDESQAIKNFDSSTARAVRCINARYRIAMTGTPIENSLAELYSQLEFLNPGLFRRESIVTAASPNGRGENAPIVRIRRAVRPFILRRTKSEVAKDLPPKTEQTIFCEMPPSEQSEYDDLLHYYQRELVGPVDDAGQGMQVLAALTRLRQAACHPGLLKAARVHESSAKLELLCERLETVVSEGHKALVFSQFTSFLRIIKGRLEENAYGLCYLDGETKDRASVVADFQNNDDKKVFLISLKAGGVGLNLTAADYVFIMDPWWNPAAESQAIDRAYRIGQRNPVFAYRLVTRNTVEEKVMQLQNSKRSLASAVIDAEMPSGFSLKDILGLLM